MIYSKTSRKINILTKSYHSCKLILMKKRQATLNSFQSIDKELKIFYSMYKKILIMNFKDCTVDFFMKNQTKHVTHLH